VADTSQEVTSVPDISAGSDVPFDQSHAAQEFLHANKVYIRRINHRAEAVKVVTIPRHGVKF